MVNVADRMARLDSLSTKGTSWLSTVSIELLTSLKSGLVATLRISLARLSLPRNSERQKTPTRKLVEQSSTSVAELWQPV